MFARRKKTEKRKSNKIQLVIDAKIEMNTEAAKNEEEKIMRKIDNETVMHKDGTPLNAFPFSPVRRPPFVYFSFFLHRKISNSDFNPPTHCTYIYYLVYFRYLHIHKYIYHFYNFSKKTKKKREQKKSDAAPAPS